jgi:signal transduction histidine kinase
MAIELKNRIEAINNLNKELEYSNKTKDKYFSIIAHDLRNPFNVILGFSDILLEKYNKYDDTKRLNIIKQINTSSKIIYELLENLLTWASSQRKKIELFPERLNLNKVVEKCLSSYSNNAKNKNIKIVKKVPEDIIVFADLFTLTVVINNIISNAIKFTPDEGTVTISAKTHDDRVDLTISDTGTGMSRKIIDAMNQSKNLISNPGTRNEKGTGLGLMLIKDFVAQNKGEMNIQSQQGKGTKFSVLLPVRRK